MKYMKIQFKSISVKGIMFRFRVLNGVILTTLFFSNSLFASDFADTYGFSANGMAMGNAMSATVNDWSSVFYNIAGLGKTEHLRVMEDDTEYDKAMVMKKTDAKNRIESGAISDGAFCPTEIAVTFMYTYPMFDISINRTDSTTGQTLLTNGDKDLDFGVVVMGLATDLNKIYRMPSIISSARFGLGAGIMSDLSAAKVNDVDQRTHVFMRYGREAERAVINAGLGMGFLNDAFGFGAGASISFRGNGTTMMDKMQVGSGEQMPQAQSKMDLKAMPTSVAGIYVSPGKLLPLLADLDFGASFRQECYMEIYPFDASAIIQTGNIEMAMAMAIYDYYTPNIFTAGVSYKRWFVTVDIDADFQMWSRFTVSSTNKEIYAKLVEAYGDAYRLPKLKDIIVPRIGFKYDRISWVTLMAGYYYQPSFLPDDADSGYINYLDNDKHVGSVGARFLIPKMGGMGAPVSVTVALQGQYLVKQSVTKTGPTKEDPNYSYGGWNPTASVEVSMRL